MTGPGSERPKGRPARGARQTPRRALVAGGAGFVGSHLVESLIASGMAVTILDNLSTGVRQNLCSIRSSSLRTIVCDVAKTPFGEYDEIYQLASPASPEAYGRDAIGTLRANSEGTLRLLKIARRSRARFLLASTSEVYGDPLVHPQAETYWGNVNPIGPRSQYDEGKRYAEALTVAYVRTYGIDARIVRIFNSYGPRMRLDDGRMPAAFIGAALAGEPILVHGDGSQTRSLCFVEDTIAGIVGAMKRGRSGEAYNIGRADEISVLQFAQSVKRIAKSRSSIEFGPSRPEDIKRRVPDASKALAELGWRARTSLSIGLRRTIAWYAGQVPPQSAGR